MLYFAYGSNLNIEQMAHRCPDARPVNLARLNDWRLVFRGVLDIEQHKGSKVDGVLWNVTKNCLRSLDRYEGVRVQPDGKDVGLYRRITFADKYMSYQMVHDRTQSTPSAYYWQAVKDGFDDFDIDYATLEDALARAKEASQRFDKVDRMTIEHGDWVVNV
jgi:gamma-glutamylcyclotransferase (GGCT)/AIG2-like uncharacterized protein YtfP